MKKLDLSVSIITKNEELNLERTLKAVAEIASEIIIVDSHSTDRTREIAESFGAKFYDEDWKGHIDQKNSALEKCSCSWLLMLDADEVPTEDLIISICQAVDASQFAGFSINRRTHYLGKLMKYSWQPDWNLRLVKKTSSPVWDGLDPHDFLRINGSTSRLAGDLIHYSYRDLKQHFYKTIDYARISAKSYHKSGKKFSLVKIILNPIVAFIKLYIIRRGFLDGIRGVLAGFSTFAGTFLKYAFLFEEEMKSEQKSLMK